MKHIAVLLLLLLTTACANNKNLQAGAPCVKNNEFATGSIVMLQSLGLYQCGKKFGKADYKQIDKNSP